MATCIGRLFRRIAGWFRRKPKALPGVPSATLLALTAMYKEYYKSQEPRQPINYTTLKKEGAWTGQQLAFPLQTKE